MMRRVWLALVVAVLAALLAACGGTRTVTTTKTVAAPSAPTLKQPAPVGCPKGKSFMGCSSTGTTKKFMLTPPPAGPKFVDVSNYQGDPNWPVAKGSIAGAVAKLGEGTNYIDSSAAYNVTHLKAEKIPFAVYWFVRPDGCQAEGDEIEKAARYVGGVPLIVLDEEVPSISGYASCLNSYVKAVTGRNAAVYRSSGNNFDSSSPGLVCWVAAYGPSKPPACSGRALKAWQYTDGRYGYPTYVPGVGTGDVSVDYGLLSLVKPKPKTLTQKLGLTRLDGTVRHFGKVKAQERNTALTYLKAGCVRNKKSGQYVRKVCKSSANHLQKLVQRLRNIHAHLHVAWSKPKKPSPMGGRLQVLWHLFLGHRKNWTSWAQLVHG